MLPAIGIGMMAAGTAMNLYGTHQRDKATKQAMEAYQRAVAEKTAQERAQLMEEQGVFSQMAGERQQGIGQYLSGIAAAQRPQTDDGFRQRQAGALTDIGRMTQGGGQQYAYTGTPRTESEGQQTGQTQQHQNRLGEALLADYTMRQIDEREKMAGHRMAYGDLLRQSRGSSLQQKFALAKALRDLDWQRKSAAMQGQLDEAGKKGQWMNVLGGLGTQAGGLAMTAGLAGAGGGTGGEGTTFTGPPGAETGSYTQIYRA
jgi:hypothetical protein